MSKEVLIDEGTFSLRREREAAMQYLGHVFLATWRGNAQALTPKACRGHSEWDRPSDVQQPILHGHSNSVRIVQLAPGNSVLK